MLWSIQIYYIFHEILSIGHLVMAHLLISNQYIHIKFHQIPLIGYLVMAPDGRARQTDMENIPRLRTDDYQQFMQSDPVNRHQNPK